MTGISPADLAAFIQIFEESEWDEANIILGADQLQLRKRPGRPLEVVHGAVVPAAVVRTSIPSEIVAPHIATFHRAVAPGGAPLVDVGQRVAPDTQVGRLRVLDTNLPVLAGTSGIVLEIPSNEGDLVEFGQVLLVIDQDAA